MPKCILEANLRIGARHERQPSPEGHAVLIDGPVQTLLERFSEDNVSKSINYVLCVRLCCEGGRNS